MLKHRETLLQTLRAAGYTELELGEQLPLYGYAGDVRPERAEIVIRRQYVGTAANDIGFRWDAAQGGYVPIVSEYDRSRAFNAANPARQPGGSWVEALHRAYSEQVVTTIAGRLRASVSRRQEGGLLKIKLQY